jgi:hypothetical protein
MGLKWRIRFGAAPHDSRDRTKRLSICRAAARTAPVMSRSRNLTSILEIFKKVRGGNSD